MGTLTDTAIKNSKPKDKEYTLNDGDGLHLLIKPDGKKQWIIRYTFDGTKKKTTFKTYPLVGLAQARTKRDEIKRKAIEGIDPSKERREAKKSEEQTLMQHKLDNSSQFHKIVLGWFDILKLEPITMKKRIRAFERDIFPHFCKYKDNKPLLIQNILSSKQINDIKHGEVLSVIKIKEVSAPETAHRLLADFDRIWRYAISHGFCEHNIIANISKRDSLQKTNEKHHPKITDEKILGELLRAIDNYSGGAIVQSALQFVAIIPLRADNLCKLKWSQINFDNTTLTIPRADMKVKDNNIPDFVLMLPHQAISILKNLHPLTGWGEWVFHGARNNLTHMNPETPNKTLRYLGFNDELTGRKQVLHSFRGTFRSLAETYSDEHKADFTTMERVLDHHEKSAVVRAYNHNANYTEKMKPLLQWWADFLDQIKEIK